MGVQSRGVTRPIGRFSGVGIAVLRRRSFSSDLREVLFVIFLCQHLWVGNAQYIRRVQFFSLV